VPVQIREFEGCLVRLLDISRLFGHRDRRTLSSLAFFDIVGDGAILDRKHHTRVDALARDGTHRSNGHGVFRDSAPPSGPGAGFNIFRVLNADFRLRFFLLVVHVACCAEAGRTPLGSENERKGRSKKMVLLKEAVT
jgi:hypothetical protein